MFEKLLRVQETTRSDVRKRRIAEERDNIEMLKEWRSKKLQHEKQIKRATSFLREQYRIFLIEHEHNL